MAKARIESVLSAIFVALSIVTARWPTWIESLFGIDPDAGSGALEWSIVGGFAILAVLAAGLARRHYRIAKAA